MQERVIERNICLTEDEAIGLLDIVMTCPGDLTPDQRAAMLKLSDFCRQFLREGVNASPSLSRTPLPARPSPYAA